MPEDSEDVRKSFRVVFLHSITTLQRETGFYSKGMFQKITSTEGRQREAARLSIRKVIVCLLTLWQSQFQQLKVGLA